MVDLRQDEGISDSSRVFFLDSAHRLSEAVTDSDVPSVNIRGVIDPVSGEGLKLIVGGPVMMYSVQ